MADKFLRHLNQTNMRIPVKLSDGRTGTIEESDYNPQSMVRLDAPKQVLSTSTAVTPQIPQQQQKSLSQNVGEGAMGFLKGALGGILNPAINLANKGLQEQRKAVENTKKGDIFGAIMNAAKATKNTFISPESGRAAAETASLAVPFGKAKAGAGIASRALTKYLAPGAAVGALSGAADANATPESVLGNSVLGAGAAGGLGALSKILSKGAGATNNLINSGKQRLSDEAAQGISKASPTVYRKALEEHGLDVNTLIKKHVPKGADYDTLLGDVTKRGGGGVLGFNMGQQEQTIKRAVNAAGATVRVSGDDFVKALNSEKSLLKKTVGNEEKVKALEAVIKETQSLFKNGVSTKRLLDLKRAADSKFGRAVIEEQTGSVASSAQKIIANVARKKLKEILPTVKNALDTETELYTLKPILNHARSVTKTSGSEIRLGKLSNIDLTKPGTWLDTPLDFVMRNPKTSSQFLNPKMNKPSEGASNPIMQQILGQAGARMPSALSGVGVNQESNTTNTTDNQQQSPDIKNQLNQDVLSISQSVNNEGEDKVALVKKALAVAMIQDLGNGGKNITELKSISDAIDQAYGADKEKETNKKYSEGDKKFLLAKNEATKAMDLLDKGTVTTGKLAAAKSGLEEFFGTQDPNTTGFKAQLATARTAARNALLGANMSEQELKSYLDAIFSYSNEPQIIKAKLQTFIKSMQDYEGSIAGNTPDQLLAQ